jgi:hypothetical protein
MDLDSRSSLSGKDDSSIQRVMRGMEARELMLKMAISRSIDRAPPKSAPSIERSGSPFRDHRAHTTGVVIGDENKQTIRKDIEAELMMMKNKLKKKKKKKKKKKMKTTTTRKTK